MKRISFFILFFLHCLLSISAEDISLGWEIKYENGNKKIIDLPFVQTGDIKKVELIKKIQINNNNQDKILILGSIDDGDKVYLNDKLIGKTDIEFIDDKHYKSYYDLDRIYYINKENFIKGSNKIRIEIENYIGDYGVKGDTFVLADKEEFFQNFLYDYQSRVKNQYLIYMVFIGIFLMSGIKYFMDYLFFRLKKENLYVAMLLGFFALYTFWRVPGRDYIVKFSSYTLLKWDFLTAVAIVIFTQMFIVKFFELKRSMIFKILASINFLVFLLISVLDELKKVYFVFGVWNVILVAELIVFIYFMLRKKKSFEVSIISMGLIILFFTTVYDILYFWRIVDLFKRSVLMYGYFAFALTVIIAKSYDYYEMRLKLRRSNQELEKKVEEKTEQLKKSNLRLGVINSQLKSSLQEIRSKEDQLIRSEKLASLGEFAGEITHEIKNPLGAILTNIQLLLLDLKDFDQEDERIVEMLDSAQIVEAASKQAKSIITNILNYSRIDEGAFKEVDIMHIITSVELLVKKDLNKIGIDFEIIECSNFKIKGKSGELTQVLLNFIVNARDAIIERDPEKKKIILRCKCEKDTNIIEIEDNGIGMTELEKENIFKPFFTTKDEGKGTGLGMSVTYAILKRHSCEVKIYSEKNIGTKFILEFKENTD